MAVLHLLFLRDSERIDLRSPVACWNQGAVASLDSALVIVQFWGDSFEPVLYERGFMSEATVRAMRDKVFEIPSSDKNWDACRENWMRSDSVEWLESKTRKETVETNAARP